MFTSLLSIPLLASLLTITTQSYQASAAPAHWNQTLEARQGVNTGFPYGSEKVRGVNLGGWLLLEPFITPSIFDPLDGSIVDEYTFGQNQGDRGAAEGRLRQHWDSWITRDDFYQIRAAGLNHVRLPIGYWAFVSADEAYPYITGSKEYLYRAISWARETGLKVIIDLHGAPGSQNGFDNSGQRGSANWGYNQGDVQRTKEIVEGISREFSDPQYYGVVTALAILNEPAGFTSSSYLATTRQFTIDAYYAARYPWASQGNNAKSGLLIIYSDAFQPSNYWNGVFNYPDATDVALDNHVYQVFSPAENQRSWGEHLTSACNSGGNLRASPNWPIVGEWSLAVYDCARWLNGRGIGARYDGSYPGSYYIGSCGEWNTGSGQGFSNDYKTFLRDYFDTQTQTWENNGQGWIYWSWKMENAAEWSYQAGLNGGWIPYNPTEHNGYKCS
ncbi:hypothetical protein FFLO_06708 [Filobasidium floriforme]|uniref:Glycoside hydrolase family 5 domain-containing protein n=1 Tax=Filobasidium floriforme TaxID=5210 RepID=A0A8K0NLV6_9TREE|nr:hypothetical protein FFLO_06708 [Filobasidium floriforme]